MSVYLPIWALPGNTVVETWVESNLISGTSKYKRIMVKYLDNKGREQIATKQVIWEIK